MRTKALVCAAVFAAGIVSSMAQVYSLNVVGYYNVTIPGSAQQMIANQLNTTNNTLAALIPAPPVNSQFYKYTTGTGYTLYQFDEFDNVWLPNGNVTLNPGEGGFFRNPNAGPLTLTFVGEVMQGSLTNPIPAGYSIRSSMVPQAGDVNALGFPAVPNDQIFRYVNPGGFQLFQFDEFDNAWLPSVPNANVGESFFVNKVGAANWVRNFTVQ
jgi:hypothetical protein